MLVVESMRISEEKEGGWRWRGRYFVVFMGFMAVTIMYLHRVIIAQALPIMCMKYGWDKTQEAWVHSSFYAGYITTQIAGGIMSNKYGGKPLALIGILIGGAITVFTPLFGRWFPAMIVGRIILGMGQGLMYTSLLKVMSNWMLPRNRSFSVSLAWTGGQIGTIIALGGYLYLADIFGWGGPFYIFGSVGLGWCVLWIFYVTETAGENSQISIEEKKLICGELEEERRIKREERQGEGGEESKSIPWRSIFQTPSVYAVFIVYYSYNWSFYLLTSYLPRYLSTVLGFTDNVQGILSTLPYLGLWLSSNISSYIADYMIQKNVSKEHTRKIMIIAGFVPGAILFFIVKSISYRFIILTSLTFSVMTSGLANGSLAPMVMDISMEYASMIVGVGNFIGGSAGIFSPAVAGLFLKMGNCRGEFPETQECQTYWGMLFYLAGAIYVAGIVALIVLFKPSKGLRTRNGTV